jgi:hypothetical protein
MKIAATEMRLVVKMKKKRVFKVNSAVKLQIFFHATIDKV